MKRNPEGLHEDPNPSAYLKSIFPGNFTQPANRPSDDDR